MAPEQHDPFHDARESLQRAEEIIRSLRIPAADPRLLSNTICYLGTLVLMGWAIKHGYHVYAGIFLVLSLLVIVRRRRI